MKPGLPPPAPAAGKRGGLSLILGHNADQPHAALVDYVVEIAQCAALRPLAGRLRRDAPEIRILKPVDDEPLLRNAELQKQPARDGGIADTHGVRAAHDQRTVRRCGRRAKPRPTPAGESKMTRSKYRLSIGTKRRIICSGTRSSPFCGAGSRETPGADARGINRLRRRTSAPQRRRSCRTRAPPRCRSCGPNCAGRRHSQSAARSPPAANCGRAPATPWISRRRPFRM